MRRACAVALAVSICACAKTGLISPGADAGPDTGIAGPEPGDLLWAAAIERGAASDVVASPDGDLIAVGANGDGAVFHGAAEGEIAVDAAGVFLARYAANGEIASVESPVLGRGLTAHAVRSADGALLLSGAFYDAATFGPGSPGEVAFLSQGDDGYVARLDAVGGLSWVARLAGLGYESAIDVAAIPGGAAAAVGAFGYAVTDEVTPATATLTTGTGTDVDLVSAGRGDVFAAAFDVDGSLHWIATAGGAGHDFGYAVDARADGSVAIAGEFGDAMGATEVAVCGEAGAPAVFGAGAEGITLAPAGPTDGFVASYGPGGALEWARRVGGPCEDWIRDVAALDDGSVVAAGVIGGPAVFGAGEANETELGCGALESCDGMERVFLAAFEPDGDLAWVRASGFCSGDLVGDSGIDIRVDELAASPDGSLALAGGYRGTCPLGPGEPGEIALPTTSGRYDPFAAALAPDGALRWAATGASGCDDVALATSFTVDGDVGAAGLYGEWWGDDEALGCADPIAFGVGGPKEVVLPGPEDALGSGPAGFVALFAGH